MNTDRLVRFLKKHKWACTLLVAALVLFVLFVKLGFFRTLLLVAFVAIAFLIGMLLDRGGFSAVKDFFKKLFSRKL